MHNDTHGPLHYYPGGMKYRKATPADLIFRAELAFEDEGRYYHGLVQAIEPYTITKGLYKGRVGVTVFLFNDETGEEYEILLSQLEAPCWGERA